MTKVDLKFAKFAYLQNDHSLLVIHSKYNEKTGKNDEWGKLYKSVGVENRTVQEQVVIHSKAALILMLKSSGISYIDPRIYPGQNKEHKVGYILLHFDTGRHDVETLYIPFVPGICGSEFTFNQKDKIAHPDFESLKAADKFGFGIKIIKVIE